MKVEGNIECFWSDLKTHPKCPHGPTLLFAVRTEDDLKYFYACSACRDRKICKFYLKKGGKLSETDKKKWEGEIKAYSQKYNNQKSYIRFHELLSEQPERRAYCHTCEKLISVREISKHPEHEVVKNISDDQMRNPTTLLKPRTDSKKEAQYLFSKKATADIVNLLINLGAKHVLCIGAPRIHEYISQNHDDKLSSLLLDFDERFHNFFGPLNFCWYNLFNHHFFDKESQSIFKDFLTQNNGRDIYLVCDPPFGGRVEPISQTVKTISDLHKKLNGLSDDDELKVMFFMPCFMKSIIQLKSNPAGVDGGLKGLKMAEYKVDYDNHKLFCSGPNGRKLGSLVRIFTNIPLNLIKLSEDDGYKYCKKCDKWVGIENKHCKKCKACTSEDGRRYKHCDVCNRCVKPNWKHCKKCKRCAVETHFCGSKPKVSGHCIKCNSTDHVSKFCPEMVDNTDGISTNSQKKRKAIDDGSIKKNKKLKLNGLSTIELSKKTKEKNKIVVKHKNQMVEGDDLTGNVKKQKLNGLSTIEPLGKKKKKDKEIIKHEEDSIVENDEDDNSTIINKKQQLNGLSTIEPLRKKKKKDKQIIKHEEDQMVEDDEGDDNSTIINKKQQLNGLSTIETSKKKKKKKNRDKKIVKQEENQTVEEKEASNRVEFEEKSEPIETDKTLKIKNVENDQNAKIDEENERVAEKADDKTVNSAELGNDARSKVKKKIKMSIIELKGDSKIILPKKIKLVNSALDLKTSNE